MNTCARWLAVLLIVGLLPAYVGLAAANTELVPASRLVAPYWDINPGRATLFLLNNVSKTVDLLTSPDPFGNPVQPARGVHVEFYDRNCARQEMTADLSVGDLDQLDIKLVGVALPNGQGWADLDVRQGDARRGQPSIQCNVLMGTVVSADVAGNFAVAYPMASSTGSSMLTGPSGEAPGPCAPATGPFAGGVIVTRDSAGAATEWYGGYEPFPARLVVPFFFAEGGPSGMTAQIVIAAPADGNWFLNFAPCSGVPCPEGESPGQHLSGLTMPVAKTGWLMDGTGVFWDACENTESRSFGGHWINGQLSDTVLPGVALGPKAVETFPWTHPGLSCKNQTRFPSADDDDARAGKGATVGWIDLPNTLADSSSSAGGVPPQPRGMVGILIQNTATGSRRQGDVVRLWGDPAYGGRGLWLGYSWTDLVSHSDLDPTYTP